MKLKKLSREKWKCINVVPCPQLSDSPGDSEFIETTFLGNGRKIELDVLAWWCYQVEEGELVDYGNSNEFPSLFLWKNREKADRKGQHDLIQRVQLAWGRHNFLWFTFYRCSVPCTSSKGNDALLVSTKSLSTLWPVLFYNFHFSIISSFPFSL